ncbi:HAD family hydrolase [Acinetobacter kanungonis]|uniref:HAD family hydrolase n=1 Tax=Acinetobacter kanungonis TaxID=2699469 RepID=UPI00137A840D|nr:HAD-IA family hydrolase [Acinetobacter kanungonis]NCI77288.1 HAD family hydrolase [Acinetobacter kanungonis]
MINSVCALENRKAGNWGGVYSKINKFEFFDGIECYLNRLVLNNIPFCIVTSSPRSYCENVIASFGIKAKFLVCYHDTKMHKPHPEPILLAKNRLINEYGCNSIISVGDTKDDIVASKRANVVSVAALWGSEDRDSLRESKADLIFETVLEMDEMELM